jgi:hypothetical protein
MNEMKKILTEIAEVGYKDYVKKAKMQDKTPMTFNAYFKIVKFKYDTCAPGFMKLFELYRNRHKVVKENAKTVWVEAPDGNVVKKKKKEVFKKE